MAKGKVIISCAITGSIHTPSMSPHIPITSQEIAEAAIGAAEAGAVLYGSGSLTPAPRELAYLTASITSRCHY